MNRDGFTQDLINGGWMTATRAKASDSHRGPRLPLIVFLRELAGVALGALFFWLLLTLS